jgi:galactose oxidase-like protein
MRRVSYSGVGHAAGVFRRRWPAGRVAPSRVMPWRAARRGGLCSFVVVAAVLSAQSAVLASSTVVPTWTRQASATSPSARYAAAMAYDAATGDIVLFGGLNVISGTGHTYGDTWTWNGSAWTKQHPATSPPARGAAAMTYDAATGDIVLFGGNSISGHGHQFGDTWTWDGSTWTKQHPATSPPGRSGASLAYDPATGNAVLFGGFLHGTWTWDGSTWTKQQPATSPPLRGYAPMAYDPATGNVVLFGGEQRGKEAMLGDTWIWDGSAWTKQHPATSPPARGAAVMAYDAATSGIVLFGGLDSTDARLGDTWTWDGSAWTQQHPATSPPSRYYAAMAEDPATGDIVLFGGLARRGTALHDTWTWGSSS